MQPVPPPENVPGFPEAERVRPKTGMGGKKKRARWVDKEGRIIEWDYAHGSVEVYDAQGRHLGEFDTEGRQVKEADPTRRVEP